MYKIKIYQTRANVNEYFTILYHTDTIPSILEYPNICDLNISIIYIVSASKNTYFPNANHHELIGELSSWRMFCDSCSMYRCFAVIVFLSSICSFSEGCVIIPFYNFWFTWYVKISCHCTRYAIMLAHCYFLVRLMYETNPIAASNHVHPLAISNNYQSGSCTTLLGVV